jgi:hypothetical protein
VKLGLSRQKEKGVLDQSAMNNQCFSTSINDQETGGTATEWGTPSAAVRS